MLYYAFLPCRSDELMLPVSLFESADNKYTPAGSDLWGTDRDSSHLGANHRWDLS